MKISLLHKKIALLTRVRKFEEAFADIENLSTNYSRETETYLVKAYIYRSQGQYDLALDEIDKAIKVGNKGYVFISEMVKRKKNGR